jgi:hypothetical protein
MGQIVWFASLTACVGLAVACDFPRPADVGSNAADDAGARVDAQPGVDDGRTVDGSTQPAPLCNANQALRCEANHLVRCNGDGSGEISENCSLDCDGSVPRCRDVNPSNGLAPFLDMTADEPDLNLGIVATIDTDNGSVIVDGATVVVKSTMVTQSSAPTIRVFIVHGLTAAALTIKGTNAVAIVSNSDINIGGILAASALLEVPGPGRFNDGTCKGADAVNVFGAHAGAGGGGFGSTGGSGGSAVSDNGSALAGAGGNPSGNPMLVPLRGGCDSGNLGMFKFGAGGGAVQLVSRTKVAVSGVVAANGSALVGGGSGGGILLEAPAVEVSGAVVANGGGGSGGCIFPIVGEDGRLDATPAAGGAPCNASGANGGNGGAGNTGAGNGVNANTVGTGAPAAFGGFGGGSVGRIRVNTSSGGLRVTGLVSPNPSTGTIATR